MVLSPEEEGDDQNIRAIRDAALRGAASAQRPDDAEDAAQDALLAMHTSSSTFEDPVAAAWRAGRFRGIDQGRRAARRRAAERDWFQGSEYEVASPERIVVARLYLKAILAEARRILTPAEYDGLLSLFLEGGTVSDGARALAELTGRDVETVRTQIRRAVDKMRGVGGDDDD